jgi:hypothetical protein
MVSEGKPRTWFSVQIQDFQQGGKLREGRRTGNSLAELSVGSTLESAFVIHIIQVSS